MPVKIQEFLPGAWALILVVVLIILAFSPSGFGGGWWPLGGRGGLDGGDGKGEG
ncbi:MAG: hypothetical protein AB1500_12110 [Bacillota bacterium]